MHIQEREKQRQAQINEFTKTLEKNEAEERALAEERISQQRLAYQNHLTQMQERKETRIKQAEELRAKQREAAAIEKPLFQKINERYYEEIELPSL